MPLGSGQWDLAVRTDRLGDFQAMYGFLEVDPFSSEDTLVRTHGDISKVVRAVILAYVTNQAKGVWPGLERWYQDQIS